MSVVKRILGVPSVFTFVILCFALISPSDVIAERMVWEYVDEGDCRGGKTIDGKKIDIHTTSGFIPDNNVIITHPDAKIAICWDQITYKNRFNKEVFCAYKTTGLPCSGGTQPGMRYEKKPYSPGRSIKIYNNTGATLTFFVIRSPYYSEKNRWSESYSIPPNTITSLFNILRKGRNEVRFEFYCVEGMPSIGKGIYFSGNETRRYEIEISPNDFGKHDMSDRPGCK